MAITHRALSGHGGQATERRLAEPHNDYTPHFVTAVMPSQRLILPIAGPLQQRGLTAAGVTVYLTLPLSSYLPVCYSAHIV
ncbi:hypothetical protein BaRGS_00002124 [Batillaria attramentaria]|uniref:Uncharacterized protein n=1 Tax=Batillaria attramentaria TaxID=370345 RepID=A0ABD0M5H5_9CAEN